MRSDGLDAGQECPDTKGDVVEQLRNGEVGRVLLTERTRVEMEYVDPPEPLGETGDRRGRRRYVRYVHNRRRHVHAEATQLDRQGLQNGLVHSDQPDVVPLSGRSAWPPNR